MIFLRNLFLAAAALLLFAIVSAHSPATHDAAWWAAHPAERERMAQVCVSDLDGLGRSDACGNVVRR